MYSMLFGNNSGGGANALLDGASFYLELTHTAVPQRGSITPSFTRATTKTFTDHEGVLRTAPAGCAAFTGARFVYNLIAGPLAASNKSNDFTLWTTSNATAVGNTVTFGAPAGAGSYIYTGGGLGGGDVAFRTYVASATVSCASGTEAFQLGINDTGSSTYVSGDFIATTTPQRVSFVKTLGGTGAGVGMLVTNSVAGGAKTIIVEDAQLEDITGRADQTTPSEYVSVGVESAPYFHGSFVDGVKCFPTDLSGNPIPSTTLLGYQAEGARTNLCLQSNAFTTTWLNIGTPSATQNVVGPDGATSAWTLTDNDAGAAEAIEQEVALTAAAYTLSVFVGKTSGAQSSYPCFAWYTALATEMQAATIDTTNGVITDWTGYTGFTMAAGRSVRISSYNEDFWRVELTKTGTATGHKIDLFPAGTTNPTQSTGAVDAAAQGSAVFYGAQVELGSFASSYIATTTAAVPRDADVLTYSSAGNIDGTKGWCYAEVTSNAPNSEQVIYLAGTGAGGYAAYHDSDGALKLFDAAAARSLIAEPHPVSTPTSIAVSWGGSSSQGAVNGTVGSAQGFDGDISLVGANIGVGCNAAGIGQIFGTIRNVRIGQRQLSASEMQAITS